MEPLPETRSHPAGLLLRAILPCAILAAGWLGFKLLAVEAVEEPSRDAEEVTLRTRVAEIGAADFPVVIKTHAIVQSHNRVTLAAEVSATVSKVSPSFEVGSYFSKGEVLVELDPRDYETALSISKSQLAASESALKLARLNEERKLRLIKSNAVSQAEVDVASATREQAEADVDLAETQVEQAEVNLQRTKVLAPFDGRVQSKLIGIGQMAGANSPLGEVFAVDFAEVRLPISADQRRYLKLPEFSDDPPVEVTLRDAITESSEQVWRGRIVRTEGVLDENSRELFAIARIDDPFGKNSGGKPLRIGQPVVAFIEGDVLHNVLALPRYAVRQLNKVVLVDPSELTLRSVIVETLWSDAKHVVVPQDAIPEGMWIATSPMSYTPEGAKVEIIPEADTTTTIAGATSADADTSVTN